MSALPPITIEHRPVHEYVEIKGETRCRLRIDGLLCMKGPNHPWHRGYAPSTNALGSGDRKAYQSAKKNWSANWREHVEAAADAAGWPRGEAGQTEATWTGVGRVLLEIQVAITQRRDIDADNITYGTVKPFGDALVEMGILRKDTFRHFGAGEVSFVIDRDNGPWTRVMLIPFDQPQPWDMFELKPSADSAQEALFAAG